jgi:tetratricopeptide (TPR) repeat protein
MNELDEQIQRSLSAAPAFSLSPRFAAAYRRIQQGILRAQDLYGCLDQMLRLFTGMSAGLARHLDPSRPEIAALASGLDSPLQYERLLRFSINLLRNHEPQPAQQRILEIFFPNPLREDISAPLHTAWLQLGSEASPLPPLSRWVQGGPDLESQLPRYREVLESWLQAAQPALQSIQWQFSGPSSQDRRDIQSWLVDGRPIGMIPPCPWETEDMTSLAGDNDEWSPQWSRQEFDRITTQFEARFPALAVLHPPDFLLIPTRQQLGGNPSAYLLLEGPEGTGKSLCLAGLQQSLMPDLAVLHFPVRSCFRGDFQTLIEEVDEGIQTRLDAQLTNMIPLGPLVIQELNRRYSPLSAAEKFQAYLSQLVLRNGQRFVLALDGLDEAFEGADSNISLADYLPDQLPDGVFLLLSYRSDGCSPRLQRRITQLLERGALPLHFPLHSQAYTDWCQQILMASFIKANNAAYLVAGGFPLMISRLLGQGLEAGYILGPRWPQPGEVVGELLDQLEKRWGDSFFRLLMVLATSYTAVPVEEFSDLGFDPKMIHQLLEDVPALFQAQRPTLHSGWQLQLAHENLRIHLQEHYSHRYSQACQRLASRAAHQLLQKPGWATPDPDSLHSGSFRLDCLYRWLLDSQNLELTESVVASKPLGQFRNQVCLFLEQKGRFHHKLSILQGLKSCLEVVLLHHETTELRDELAWAYNSRGLTFLHLGQFAQCLTELEFAEQQFRLLVDQRHQVHYRSGLASALNRRSEALRSLAQVGEAWECAHQSVEHHRQSLVEGGPQQPRLGLARALVQRARCAADHSLWPRALTDLQESLSLLEQSTRQAQARGNQGDVATHFNEWVKALIVRAEAYRVVGENDNSLLDLDQALLLTHHLEEVQGVDWTDTKAPEIQVLQARAYEALQGFEEALDAYDEAIHGYSQQVRQGRLDLRLALAEAYHARADLRRRRSRVDDAIEDYTRSLAFQAQLIECEEQSDLRPFRAQTHQGRGDCLGILGRRREALQDYDKAIEDFLYGLNSGKLQQPDLRRLASVYFNSGQIYLQLHEASQAADRAASAIRLLEERLGGPGEAVAQAHLLQAEALFHLGDTATGLETASKAIQVLSLRVRGGSGSLERQLANAHRLRAELAQAQGDLIQALKDFGLAYHLYGSEGSEPDRVQQAEVLRRRAALQVKLLEYDAALEDLQAASDLLSGNPDEALDEKYRLRRLRAEILAKQKRYPLAISELLAALEDLRQRNAEPPQRLELLLELMSHQARLQQWQDFIILYSEFLKTREESPETPLSETVATLFNQIESAPPNRDESVRMARADVLVALARLYGSLQPEASGLVQARALHQRGSERLASQRVTEALEDLSEAIAQLRSQPLPPAELLTEVYARRAEGLLQAGLHERALRDLNAATVLLTEGTGNAALLAQLVTQKALLLRRSGHYSQVVQELTAALGLPEVQPLGPEVLSWMYLGRALAYDQLRLPDRALIDYREAAQLLSQIQHERADVLQERLRCRIRLLSLEHPSHPTFLHFCAEDSLACLSRLRVISPEMAGEWVIAWVHQWLQLPTTLLTARLLSAMAEELSHYQPGPLCQPQCDQLSHLLGILAARLSSPALAERLLGLALHLALLGDRRRLAGALLDNLALLYRLYHSNPEHVPALNLDPGLRALHDLQAQSPPDGELGVRWNNLIRSWLGLSDHQLAACRADRNRLQSLRLW